MTYREYELFVKEYFKTQLKNSFNTDIDVKHQENLKTVTNREYNIDLNYKFNVGGVDYLTIIECKHWKSTITRDLILTVKEKASDLAAHKSILVTTKGFQSGAIEYAKEKGVGLIKMTTSGQVEVVANFLGADIANILFELSTETDISEEGTINDNISIIFPKKEAHEYLAERFGIEVLKALFLYEQDIESFNSNQIDSKTKELILSVPENWYVEYQTIENCGLSIPLYNERDIRLTVLMLYFLKHSLLNH